MERLYNIYKITPIYDVISQQNRTRREFTEYDKGDLPKS